MYTYMCAILLQHIIMQDLVAFTDFVVFVTVLGICTLLSCS